MATNGDSEPTTEHLVEETRKAKAAAEAEVREAHDDAARLETELEEEGLTADTQGDHEASDEG